jgi:hypothetical protein
MSLLIRSVIDGNGPIVSKGETAQLAFPPVGVVVVVVGEVGLPADSPQPVTTAAPAAAPSITSASRLLSFLKKFSNGDMCRPQSRVAFLIGTRL